MWCAIAGDGYLQRELELKEAEQGIYAHVAVASGLGKPGQIVADEIADAVRRASAVLQEEAMEGPLAEALDLVPEEDGGSKGICTVAALMLCNACLLQRRLRDEPEMKTILRLDQVAGARHPKEVLEVAWEAILEKDYAPVFRPALAVLRSLREGKAIDNAIRMVAECANRVADSLSDLGYDHAGPLYHRILGSAKSDGAFYTNNLSAVMLARLAFTRDLIDWSDPEAVAALRIIDPACGTGTLLMATLQALKARVAETRELSGEDDNALHKQLVEDVLCGLDINQHGVQLAACNMTLGAPTVDYARMNLLTMPHGPQADGTFRAGSLELLNAEAERLDLFDAARPKRAFEDFEAEQVDESEVIRFPLRGVDAVIMNAPFTDNRKRGRKFSPDAVKGMQRNEIDIRDRLETCDSAASEVITTNSIATFFTPLADKLLPTKKGVLAKVLPVTACIGASGLAERRFLAQRFHVERIVTTHDPKRINFSENTSIHECLLVCRRRAPSPHRIGGEPTQFVSLRRMPRSADEAISVAEAITSGEHADWGVAHSWPAERVRAGNWTPAQWYDGELAEIVWFLEEHKDLTRASSVLTPGPTGQAAQDSWRRSDDDDPRAVMVFDSVSAAIRQTMMDVPEQRVVPGGRRTHLHENVLNGKAHLMLATRYDTVSGRLTALWSDVSTFGFGWIPATGLDSAYEQAACAWWNSTPGRLLLLNRRAKKLTYPKWSVAHLMAMPCPSPGSRGCADLADAWKRFCHDPLLPLRDATQCTARQAIDEAAATALAVDASDIADWRRRLVSEPTITNARAKGPGSDEES